MISVQEAKHIIQSNIASSKKEIISLSNACGLTLAEDIFSPMDVPQFNQSAMDGFAFKFVNDEMNMFTVVGEMQAGASIAPRVGPGEAIRIFTGAPVPDTCDTVVMKEKTCVEDNVVSITQNTFAYGDNVRLKGSEIQRGDIAMEKGLTLTPAAIGFAASLGISELLVFASPKITLIITGDELVEPGNPLYYGQVYNSNAYTLQAALEQIYPFNVKVLYAKDTANAVERNVKDALSDADFILLTGGVSAGDYDFVPQVLANCGITQLFHKIKQKPGKPLYFGKNEGTIVFGLPGNPASVLTCFYEYVMPALLQYMHKQPPDSVCKLILTKPISKKSGLTHFLKGRYTQTSVTPLQAQESYRMSSFSMADCFICLDENCTDLQAGEIVEVHKFPFHYL
ncbi:gephyrin-like molybdotransferase Glp [Chitinophagaceae bacterium LWZ2-11]